MPRPRRTPPARPRRPQPPADRAASNAARVAEVLERDRPLIADALAWAAEAGPGAMLPLPSASAIGLEACAAALRGEGFACEVRGASLALLPEGRP